MATNAGTLTVRVELDASDVPGDLTKAVNSSLRPALNKVEREVDQSARSIKKSVEGIGPSLGGVGSSVSRSLRPALQSVERDVDRSMSGVRNKIAGLGGAFDGLAGRLGGPAAGIASAAGGITSGLAGIGTAGSAAAAGVLAVAAAAAASVAVVAAIGAAAAVVGKQFYDLGADADELNDKLAIKTGGSVEELAALKDSIQRMGTTNVPLGFSEIADVAVDVTRNLKLTGPALEEVTSRLANLGRMTGEAVDIKKLGQAFNKLGVKGGDQVAALNQLNETAQDTGLSVNDMVSSLASGGLQLKQAGLSFGESAALLGQLSDAGIDAQQVLPGLTVFLRNAAKEGKPTAAAFKDATTQISGLLKSGNELEAKQLAANLFGRSSLPVFEAIKSGTLDLDNLSKAFDGTVEDINALSTRTSDWSERWTLLKSQIGVALEPFGTAVFDGVNAQLGNLAKWITAHQEEIVGFFVELGSAALDAADFVLDGVGQIAQGLGELIAPIGDVLGAATKLQAALADMTGDRAEGDRLRAEAEGYFAWGETLSKVGQAARDFDPTNMKAGLAGLGDEAMRLARESANAKGNVDLLATGITTLPDGTVTITDTTPENIKRVQDLGYEVTNLPDGSLAISVVYRDQNGNPIDPSQLVTPPRTPAFPGDTPPTIGGGRADGGPIFGVGGPRADNQLIWASPGEHMLTAREVAMMGGHGGVYRFRNAVNRGMLGRFADGGAIDGTTPGPLTPEQGNIVAAFTSALRPIVDSLNAIKVALDTGLSGVKDAVAAPNKAVTSAMSAVRTATAPGGFDAALLAQVPKGGYYDSSGDLSKGLADCTSGIEDLVNIIDGKSTAGRSMDTGNAAEWLASRGFMPTDTPMPGTFQVGFNVSHMEATLPNGTNVNYGNDASVASGGTAGATGAWDSSFTQQYYRPIGAAATAADDLTKSTRELSVAQTDQTDILKTQQDVATTQTKAEPFDYSSLPLGDPMRIASGAFTGAGGTMEEFAALVGGKPDAAAASATASVLQSAAQPFGAVAGDAIAAAVAPSLIPTATPTAPDTETSKLLAERNPAVLGKLAGYDVPDYTRQGGDPGEVQTNTGPGFNASGAMMGDTAALIDRTFTNLEAANRARQDQLLAILQQIKQQVGSEVVSPIVEASTTAALSGIAADIGTSMGETAGPIIGEKTAAAVDAKVQQQPAQSGTGAIPGMAGGGGIFGGTPGKDSVPAMLMPGEFVLTAADVARMGGFAGVERLIGGLQANGRIQYFASGGGVGRATTGNPQGGQNVNSTVGADFFGVSQIPVLALAINALTEVLLTLIGVEILQRDALIEVGKEFKDFRGDFKAFDAAGRIKNDNSGLSDRSSSSEKQAADERLRILKLVINGIVKYVIEKILVPLGKAIGNAIVSALAGAAGGALSGGGGSIAGGIASAAISAAGAVAIDLAAEVFTIAAETFINLGLGAIGEFLQTIFPNLTTTLLGGAALEQIAGPVSAVMTGAIGVITSAIGNLMGNLGGLFAGFLPALQGFLSGFAPLTLTLSSVVGVLSSIAAVLQQIFGGLISLGAAIAAPIVAAVTSVLGGFTSLNVSMAGITNVLSSIAAILQQFFGSLFNLGLRIVSPITSAVSSAVSGFMSWVSNLTTTTNALGGVAQVLTGLAPNLGSVVSSFGVTGAALSTAMGGIATLAGAVNPPRATVNPVAAAAASTVSTVNQLTAALTAGVIRPNTTTTVNAPITVMSATAATPRRIANRLQRLTG